MRRLAPSRQLRQLDYFYRGEGGVRAVALRLYDAGLTYAMVARRMSEESRIHVAPGSLGRWMREWRRETSSFIPEEEEVKV